MGQGHGAEKNCNFIYSGFPVNLKLIFGPDFKSLELD